MTLISRLAASALVVGGLVAATAPWRVSRAVVASAFGDGTRLGVDVHAVAKGRVTFKLLPRPRLQATDLSVQAGDGAVLLDAPLLKAELDIPSLLRGAWRMTSATLVEPTLTMDVDRLAARASKEAPRGHTPAETAAGAAPRGPSPLEAPGFGAPVMLHLRSGLLRSRSASGFADLLATGVDASATWSDDGLVVSGTATVRGTPAQFTGALQRPALSLAAAGSPASIQVESPLFDLAADGVLSGRPAPGGTGRDGPHAPEAPEAREAPQPQFVGRVSLATPSLPRLLRTLDGAALALASKRAQVSGEVIARPHELSLSDAQLRLDGARFEGTLAWRLENGRGLLAGTLATDLLDVGALARDGTRDGADGPEADGLYGRSLTASPLGVDLDLRVSATTARLGRVTLDDAAFGALVRGDRLELTLDEAKAYRGLIKARAIVTLGPGGVDAHADLSAKQVELGAMSDGLSGRRRVDGALTGHAALDGHGASLRAVVSGLAGEGQIGVEGARIAGLSVGQTLRRLGRRSPVAPEARGAPTVFDRARWDLSIRDGIVRVAAGRLTAPGVALDFGAETGLSDGRVDLHAVATQTDAAGAPLQDGAAMPFDLQGFWSGPLTLVGAQKGRPGAALPLVDGFGAGR